MKWLLLQSGLSGKNAEKEWNRYINNQNCMVMRLLLFRKMIFPLSHISRSFHSTSSRPWWHVLGLALGQGRHGTFEEVHGTAGLMKFPQVLGLAENHWRSGGYLWEWRIVSAESELMKSDFDEFWWILMNVDECWWCLMIFDGFWWILILKGTTLPLRNVTGGVAQ